MLFVESRIARARIETRLRTPLLEALQGRGFAPLIRSARLHLFEQAAASPEAARELERALAERSEVEGGEPYVHGDLFCFKDYAHYLIFGDGQGEDEELRAGIIYDAETDAPSGKLDAFCRSVGEALAEVRRAAGGAEADDRAGLDTPGDLVWRAPARQTTETPERLETGSAPEAPSQPLAGAAERARTLEVFEDVGARRLLQRLSEAQAEGRGAELLAEGRGPEQEALVARLAGAGLVRREVQVSCRKDGRSLFRLPSAEALAIVTASNAVCSECGSAVADERAEELVTPTPLASSMLKDGAWLVSGLRSILGGLGIPERETVARAPVVEGETQVLANVCGEPFLFVVRDGDFTTAHARRAADGEAEAQATHLVVIAAGKVHAEARARLREHARRRARTGSETEVVFVEGLEAAAEELRPVVERVAQGALTRELFELDADAGFDVGYALAARFSLARRQPALQDLAATAAGALSGSLREF